MLEVLEVTGSHSHVIHVSLPKDDPKRRRPDVSKARELLGWEARIPLREGLRLSLPYFRSQVEATLIEVQETR